MTPTDSNTKRSKPPGEQRVLEGIVTTFCQDGSVNIAPMGPLVDDPMQRMTLRPYQSSTTYANLSRDGVGVFHVTDDAELIARAAIGQLDPPPPTRPAPGIDGAILVGACRWYAFQVISLDDRDQRTTIEVRVVEEGRQRDFFGFNRAMHAVVEAAILATRIELLPREEIIAELERLAPLVNKTGGSRERRAFEMVRQFVQSSFDAGDRASLAEGACTAVRP